MTSVSSVIVLIHVVVVSVVLRKFFFTENSQTVLSPKLNISYDYIIVGSGSAGSVVASRLSEDSHVTVLLIEAGGDDRGQPLLDTPLYQDSAVTSQFDWMYYTEPQKHSAKAVLDQKVLWPRGRALGGSSQINGNLYVRGSRHDYDRWAANGCEGWSYKDVLPFFKKSEDVQIESLKNSEYHGVGGPLTVSQAPTHPISEHILKAGLEIGYKEVDINGESQEGFMRSQATTRKGERMSASKAFLWPVIDRPNLHVLANSHVTKVNIENKKATGVEYIKDGRLQKVKASREVILSAGAVGSPQLLMLSGVGPKKDLTDLGIKVEADLPVGENLQDHLMTVMRASIKEPLSITPDKAESWMSHLEYNLFGTGYLSSNIGLETSAFMKTKQDEASPDVQLHLFAFLVGGKFEGIDFDPKVLKKMQWQEGEGLTVMPSLLRPKSVGTIRLKSTNPFEYPAIDPNYLSHPDDVKTLIRGVRVVQKLFKAMSFKDIGIKPDTRVFPTCTEMTYDTDEYWECYIRSVTLTIYHPVGTCKMGAKNDKTTVVDNKLRVKGISGLRVVDASIMPYLVSGNTNAPSIMIGERGADIIRKS